MATTLANILSGGLLDGVSKVINSIRGKSPEDAAKLEQLKTQYETEFMQAQAELEKAKIKENVDLNQIAGQNIQTEAKGNWFTSAARPSVIWMGNVVLLWNYIGRPMFVKWQLAPVNLPDMFWWTWGVVVTGYVFTRTAQDVAGNLLGGAGGSAQLPFGIKLDSKGDK